MKHTWIKKKWLAYKTCELCGAVKRKDGLNGPCRGHVRVVLRNSLRRMPVQT